LENKREYFEIGERAGHAHPTRRVDVGSACVDIRQSPKTDILVS